MFPVRTWCTGSGIPPCLGPTTMGHGIWSGTGFITKEGQPAMVYFGHKTERNRFPMPWTITWSNGASRMKCCPIKDGKPVTDMPYFDPDLWINNGIYYGLNGRNRRSSAVMMKSENLKDWEYIGELLHRILTGEARGWKRRGYLLCQHVPAGGEVGASVHQPQAGLSLFYRRF